jgi:hypothetical protein
VSGFERPKRNIFETRAGFARRVFKNSYIGGAIQELSLNASPQVIEF